MKDLHALLTEADPVRETPELPREDARALRRVVLTAAPATSTVSQPWPGAVSIAAVVVIMIAVGIAAGVRVPPPEESAAVGEVIEPVERTQVQFATPGGTRIIWTLDPEFELHGSTP